MQKPYTKEAAMEMVEHVLLHLKQKNIRITAPRKAIITYLVNSTQHPTVEQIYTDLLPQFPGMSLATVYNNVNVLVEEGFLHEMKFSGPTSHYDFLGHTHPHIICEKCGKIADFIQDMPAIHQPAFEQTGYLIHQIHLELYGICPECQEKND